MQNYDQKLQSLLSRLKSDKGVDGDLPSVSEIRGDYNTAIDFFNKTIKPLYKDRTYSDFQEDFGTPTIKDTRTGIDYMDSYKNAKKYEFPIPTESPKPNIKQEPFIDKAARGFKVLYSDVANSFVNASYGALDIYESSVVAPLTSIAIGDKEAESNLKNIRATLEKSKKDLQKSLNSDISQEERNIFYEQAGITGEVLSTLASQSSMFVGGAGSAALKAGSMVSKLATGSKVAGSVGFALGFQNGLDAINSSESGRKLQEKYKTIYASIVGTVEMITEAIPFKAIFGNNVSKRLINPIIDKTISNIVSKGIKEITPEIFEKEANIVSKKLINRATKTGSNVVKAASEEFPSEFISSASNDILNKYINNEYGQNIFDDKSWGDILHDAARNGALGAMAAGGLSGVLSAGSPKVNNHIIQTLTENKSSDGSFDIGRQKLLDEYVQTQQELGKDTSVEQLDNVINGYIDKLNKTPQDLTPIQQQAVLELSDEKNSALQKKEELEKEKDGLDIPFQNKIQQQIDAITTNIDNLDSQIGEIPSMDDSDIDKLLNEISIPLSISEKIKSIKINQQKDEAKNGIKETGTQGDENVSNEVQVSREKGGENVNKQVEEKLPISEAAIPEAEQQTEGVSPLMQQENGKERNKKRREENVLTANSQDEILASQVDKTSGAENLSDRAKEILDNSLSEYNNSSNDDKPKIISDIKEKLSVNEKGLSNIGIGLDKDMVSAGNEFLNIINQQEVKSIKESNNAIQEQVASKSVLRKKGQGLELQPMDEGDQKSKVSTKQSETIKEEINKESQLKSTKNETRGKNESNINVGEKIKGIKEERIGKAIPKIKDNKSNEILNSEPNDIRDEVIQFFVGGGKVNTEFFNSLYGNKDIKYGNVTERKAFSEAKRRLGIWNNKKGYSLDGLAEFLYNNRINDNYETNDYKNEIEDVINSFNNIQQMSKHFLDRREIKDYESDYYDKYSKEIEAEYLQDAEIYFDKLSESDKKIFINENVISDDLFYKLFNEEIENKEQTSEKNNKIKKGDNVIVSHAGNDIEGVIVKDKDGNLQVEQKYSYRGNQKTKYSLDSIKEFVEEQAKEPTTSKKIADNIRKGKINKKGNVYANTPFSLAWDSALELIAQTIEKGGDVLSAINKGIKAFKESEWYRSATKEDREIETANLEHELKIKYADSLLDTIYLSDIKKDPIYQAKKELIDALKNLRSTYKDSIVAFDKINKIYGNVNRLPKLIESISNIRDEKSFEKAREESLKYIQDLIFTTKQRYVDQLGKSLTRKIKNTKIDNSALKELNRLNPFKLNNEEIDTITDMLGTVKAQLYGKKEGLIPNENILSFVNNVKERLKKEQVEKVKKEVKEKTKDKEPEDLSVLNANISALKEDLKLNSDKYSDYLKSKVNTILEIDINNIDNKKEFSTLIANIVANKDVHGFGKYISEDKANKILLNTRDFVKNTKLGLNVGKKYTSQALQIKNIFNDPRKAAKFQRMLGISAINDAEAIAFRAREDAIKKIDDNLKKNGFENGIQDLTVGMSFTGGILADLRRNSSQEGHFENIKTLIEDSIYVLKNGNDNEKRKSDAISKYYNKYAKDAKTAEEVYDNIRKESLLKNESGKDAKGAIILYDTLLPILGKNFNLMNIESQLYQDKSLVQAENYKPRRYENTSTTNKSKDVVKDRDISGMASDIYSENNVSTSTSGTMKEESMPRKITEGDRVLNLDILGTSLDAIQEQVYDIESLEARNALHKLFQDNDMRKEMRNLLGGQWNVLGIDGASNFDILEDSVISSVKSHLGIYNTKEDKDIFREVMKLVNNYARSVLYAPKQIILQTLPLFVNVTTQTIPTFGKNYPLAVRLAYKLASNKDSEIFKNSPILLRSAPELIINAEAKMSRLKLEFDSVIKKRIKGTINTLNIPSEWSANKMIDNPDSLIARVSWMMYYLEHKQRNGEKNLDKDWNLEPIDKEASSYAEMMVSNTQGVNSQSNAPEFWKDKSTWATFGKSSLFMFSSFGMNLAANMKSDIRILATGQKQQKGAAVARLLSSILEMSVYVYSRKALLLLGAMAVDSLSDIFYGDDEEENDKIYKKVDELLSIDGMEKLIYEGLANQLLFDGFGSGISYYASKVVNKLSEGKITIGGYFDRDTKYDKEWQDIAFNMPGVWGALGEGGYYTYKASQYAFIGETRGEYSVKKGKYLQEVYNEIPTRDRVLASVLLGAEIGSTVGAMPTFIRNIVRNELRKTFPDNESIETKEIKRKVKSAEKGDKRPNPDYNNK